MLDETPYWRIVKNNAENFLRVTWKPAACDMPEQEFKEHLNCFVDLLRSTHVKKFLADASAGHFIMLPHIQEWHDHTIVPQYEKIGIKRIAFIYPDDIVKVMSLEQTFDEQRARQLHTRFFNDMKSAESWITD